MKVARRATKVTLPAGFPQPKALAGKTIAAGALEVETADRFEGVHFEYRGRNYRARDASSIKAPLNVSVEREDVRGWEPIFAPSMTLRLLAAERLKAARRAGAPEVQLAARVWRPAAADLEIAARAMEKAASAARQGAENNRGYNTGLAEAAANAYTREANALDRVAEWLKAEAVAAAKEEA